MPRCIYNIRLFYYAYLVLFIAGITFFLLHGHGHFVLKVNELHHPILDFFFKYWTHTGSVYFYVCIALVVLLIHRRYGLILSLVGILVGITSVTFKFLIFPDVPRPAVYFEGTQLLSFVEGVEPKQAYSFPSGHSMAAFAIANFFALVWQDNRYALMLLLGAFLTAFSRVYLVHHFLIDTLAGSFLGVFIATFCYLIFERYLKRAGLSSA